MCEAVCSARDGELRPEAARLQVLRDECAGANFAVFCQHCLAPVCQDVCPQQAIRKGKDGIVRIDPVLCVHCGLCMQACPEAAPHRSAGAIRKCDLCDGAPRCVEACPQQALSYSSGKRVRWIKFLRWPVQALSFLLLVVVLTGAICSLSVADWSLACPLGALQNMFSSKTILLTTVFAALFLVILSLLAGRLFCGWLCPFGFVLDLVGKILPQKLHLPGFLRTRLAKYGVAGAALGASGALGYQAFCTVCPIGSVCRSYGLQSMIGGAELAVVPALALLEVSEKRSWCRYFCPVGALLGLFAKIGWLKISIGASKCKKFSCMRCASVCPMGIIPEDALREGVSPKLNMAECIGCLRCVDVCPHGAAVIRFSWSKVTPAERDAARGRAGGERPLKGECEGGVA
jgi:ferredoxin-type protein NapH